MLTIDTILQNRYRIVRLLGQGGMGAVYQAVDERIDKVVAVKEILLELQNASDTEQTLLIKQAFRREANSLVKARHETVPDVTDYFSDGDREFLVMEFIEGDDLMKMLQKRKKPFSFDEVLPWIDQLLEALDYLHNLESPIIHRDIKPQNLKLNEWKKIKLLDFGIAKSMDKTATITQMTFVGATLDYSPIEQILRVIDPMFRELILLKHREEAERILAQDTDSRCDIFALGATFYHLLTNYPPIDIKRRTLETWEGKGDPLPSPSEINSDLPLAVSAWLKKAMEIERDDRFSTAIEMRKALQNIVAQETRRKLEKERNQAIEQANLQAGEANEIRTIEEQNLMPPQTIRLIEPSEKSKTESEKFPRTSSSPPIDSAEKQNPDTFSSVGISSTDLKFSNTDVSGFDTSEELSEISSVGGYVGDHGETELNVKGVKAIPPAKVSRESLPSGNFKYTLILAVVGILAFAVVGGGLFGFVVWMNYPSESESVIGNGNTNIVENPEVASSPETVSSSETNSDASEENQNVSVETSSETPNPVKAPVKTTKMPPKPTAKPVVRQTPKPIAKPKPTIVKTPKPIKATPTPKKKLSDDCIYNGKCS